jgi:hypothetical protein
MRKLGILMLCAGLCVAAISLSACDLTSGNTFASPSGAAEYQAATAPAAHCAILIPANPAPTLVASLPGKSLGFAVRIAAEDGVPKAEA